MTVEKHGAEPAKATGGKTLAVILVVAIGFLALIALKVAADRTDPGDLSAGGSASSITADHNDAVGDFEAAQTSGKPVYVLFHSLTCDPCIEISNVVDEVMPEYSDDVFFVNAITDDPSAQQLAADFSFQYIPTSFFLAPGGETVIDSYVGAMDATQMRGYLDALIAEQ
jgi:thioredoxin-like negative regulator of GroEL